MRVVAASGLGLAPLGAALGILAAAALTACEVPLVGVKDPPPGSTRAGGEADGGNGMDQPGPGQSGISLPDAGGGGQEDDSGGPGARCAAESHAAKMVPVDLFMLVDVSGSMLYPVPGGRTKWDLVRSALLAFFADGKSAGLGVGLQFFPLPAPCKAESDCTLIVGVPGSNCRDHGICSAPGLSLSAVTACDSFTKLCPAGTTCTPVLRCDRSGLPCLEAGKPCDGGMPGDLCNDPQLRCKPALADGCMPELYAAPALPVGELPGWEKHLALTVASVNPGGSTPMAPAVAATMPLLRMHAGLHPGRKPILVLATDGFPTGCGPNTIDTVAAAIEAGRMGTPPVPTYVVGVFAQLELVRSQLALSRLAVAGGTGVPFVLEEGKDLAQKFLAALEQIRGSALACEFEIPRPQSGTLDFGKVNVRFTPGAGIPDDLFYVGSADKCDPVRGGWYYDLDPRTGAAPSRILICESSCKRFKAEAAGAVELQVGCTSRVD